MINSAQFIEPLRALGYAHFSGVPCSYLKPFINYVIGDETLHYTGASSEGEAVGISMGQFLGGKKTVTMCQNSGLGNMVNPLTSLNYPFQIPTLLITTWRGEPGHPDEPQHILMGQITHQLLETLRIPWLPFPTEAEKIPAVLQQADNHMSETQLPFALVMSEKSVQEHQLAEPARRSRLDQQKIFSSKSSENPRMIRTEALAEILNRLQGNEAIVATTGKTGRELFSLADRPNHLYVVGGMGTASSIGLGICLARPKQFVVVIDGDGAALMKLGSMATIGYYQPENLLHIILDNEAHDSTGGQGTSSPVVEFTEVARATNYRQAWRVHGKEELGRALKEFREVAGPSLIHLKIRQGSPTHLGRPSVKPHEVKARFMEFLASTT